MRLDKSSIDAGLGYCRWLNQKLFSKRLDALSPGLPNHGVSWVTLGETGKRVYESVAKQVNAAQRGSVLTREGELAAVRKYLCDLKDGKISDASASTRGPVKHAKLHLSSITKFMGGGKRTIRGLANSGQTDRVGDIVEPEGGRWSLPTPLLWQHKSDQPIGWVRQIEARRDGLWITAELAEGIGKADEAWRMIEAGLVDSYSIGFQAEDWEPLPGGGKRFKSWSLLEVSVVTIPADPAAKIRRNAKGTGAIALSRHIGSVSLGRSNGAIPLKNSSSGSVSLRRSDAVYYGSR